MATVTLGSSVATVVKALVQTIASALGQDFDVGVANAFRLTLETLDGSKVTLKASPLEASNSAANKPVQTDAPDVLTVGTVLQASGQALTSGTKTVTVTGALATDLFVAKETATGGSAAAGFVALYASATSVKVYALDSSGAIVTGNSSTVSVYKAGAAVA